MREHLPGARRGQEGIVWAETTDGCRDGSQTVEKGLNR